MKMLIWQRTSWQFSVPWLVTIADGSKFQWMTPVSRPVSAKSEVDFFFPIDQLHWCQHEPCPILRTCSYHGKLGKPLGNYHVEDSYPWSSFFFPPIILLTSFSYFLPTLTPYFITSFTRETSTDLLQNISSYICSEPSVIAFFFFKHCSGHCIWPTIAERIVHGGCLCGTS